MTLQHTTLFEALPPATAAQALTPRPLVRRGFAAAVGLAVVLGALVGFGGLSPQAALDAEPVRPAAAAVQPVADAPVHHEVVNPGSGAVRMPFALQGYGG